MYYVIFERIKQVKGPFETLGAVKLVTMGVESDQYQVATTELSQKDIDELNSDKIGFLGADAKLVITRAHGSVEER